MWRESGHGSYIVSIFASDRSQRSADWWREMLLYSGIELLSTLAIGLAIGLAVQWLLIRLLMYLRSR